MIYDRYFCWYKLRALHLWQEREVKFVIRGKESINIIKSFIKSGNRSSIINYEPSKEAIKEMYKSGYKITRNNTLKYD